MKRIHYGWIICAGCTLLTMCTMGLVNNGFSIYLPHIISANGFTGSQGSSLITVRCLFSLFGMFLVTRYYRCFSIRLGTTIACFCSAGAFFVYSAARSLPVYYLAAALSGLSYGLGSMIPVSILISRWFCERRAFALSICTSGTSVATLVAPTVITLLIRTFGLETSFFMEACFIFLSGILVLLILRNEPAEMKLPAYGTGLCEEEPSLRMSVRNPRLTRRQWWAAYLAFGFLGAVTIASSNHLAVLFSNQGYEDMLTALAVSFFGLLLTVGKFLYGLITDRLGGSRSNTIFSAFLLGGLFLCCASFLGSNVVMFSAAALLGLGFPISTVGISVIAADFSREDQFGITVKQFQLCYALGSFLFSPAPGILADFTHSYILSYALCFCIYICFFAVIRNIYGKLGLCAPLLSGRAD